MVEWLNGIARQPGPRLWQCRKVEDWGGLSAWAELIWKLVGDGCDRAVGIIP